MEHNKRSLEDAQLTVSVTLPAAAGSATSTAIDLHVAGRKSEDHELAVVIPELPSLVEAKYVSFRVHDSADNSSFAAVASLAEQRVVGEVGNGFDGATLRWKMPPNIRQYIQLVVGVETGGGNNTAQKVTFKVLS